MVADRKTALLFPGAAVRMCGREIAFYRRHATPMRPFLEAGSDCAGVDLADALAEGGAALGELQSQILTHSFGCAAAAAYGAAPQFLAGYSLGIYPAFVAAGAISFEDGLAIIRIAFGLVEEACAGKACGMAVVIGLEHGAAERLAQACGPASVCVANSNNATSKVLSGDKAALRWVVEEARAEGAFKAEVLDIGYPYHHPGYLGHIRGRFEGELRRFTWRRGLCPIVSSIDQRFLREPEELIDFTARNLLTPVNWQGVMETLVASGVDTAYECGIGISLTQNGRMIPGAPRFVNVKSGQRKVTA